MKNKYPIGTHFKENSLGGIKNKQHSSSLFQLENDTVQKMFRYFFVAMAKIQKLCYRTCQIILSQSGNFWLKRLLLH